MLLVNPGKILPVVSKPCEMLPLQN